MARKIQVHIVGDSRSLVGAFDKSGAAAAKFGRVAKTASIAGIGGLVVGLVKVAKATVGFDKAMRNVNSIAQLGQKDFGKLSKEVLKLAGRTAQAPETLAKGLYDLVSSGFNAKQSMVILGASAKAATAGLTTTEVSTKAVASVLNAYHLPASQAAKVSDTLFQTVNAGVISFEELAQNIGDVLPFATGLGIKLGEVGAATATMTKAGISAPETMTRLKSVMEAFIKPSEGLSKALKSTGFESGEALLKSKGLQGGLEAVIKTTDGSKSSVAELFPNIRALGGALSLTGKNSKSARKDLAAFKDVTGATDRALREQQKSIAFWWDKIKTGISVASIRVGSVLVPAFAKGMSAISGFISGTVSKFDRLKSDGVGTLGALGKMIAGAFGKIDWRTVGDKIAAGMSKALDFSKKLTPAIEAGISGAVSKINGRKVLGGIVRVTAEALNALLSPSFWKKNFAAIFSIVSFVIPVGKILKLPGFGWLYRHISAPIFKAVGAVGKGIASTFGKAGSSAVTGFLTELSKTAPRTANVLLNVVTFSGKSLGKLPGVLKGIASRAVGAVSGAIVNGAGRVGGAVGRLAAGAAKAMRQAVGAFYRIGLDMISGLANGIKAMAGAAINAAAGVVKGAVGKVKGLLRIKSPSQVFHKVGEAVGQGFANGIKSSTAIVTDGLKRGLLFPIEGAIADAQQKRDELEKTFAGIDAKRERSRLKAATRPAKGRSKSDLAEARRALRDFNREQDRARKLSRIDVKVTGLERLKAFKAAIGDIRTQIADKLNAAVDAFRTNWENTTGRTIDKVNAAALDGFDQQTEAMVATSDAAAALAQMRTEDEAARRAAEDEANGQALDDALKAGDAAAITEAQKTIAATARARAEVAIEAQAAAQEAAIRATRAAERQALEDQQAAERQTRLDGEVAAFEAAQQAKAEALVASLEAQAVTYSVFVDRVTRMLAQIGQTFEGAPDFEGVVNAGPGSTKDPTKKKPKRKPKRPKKRAFGGDVRFGETYWVGETGAELLTFGRGAGSAGSITSSSQARSRGFTPAMAGGGDIHMHGTVNIGSQQAAKVLANSISWRLRNG